MTIYDRPTRELMHDFAKDRLHSGSTFTREDAVRWFAERYPKLNPSTVRMHVDAMSVNSSVREHHRNVKPASGHDLFFKLAPNSLRLWESQTGPAPIYRDTIFAGRSGGAEELADTSDQPDLEVGGSPTFALESHLRDYLSKNLSVIEPGLRLYDDEGLSGVEFPVGGRFIDILGRSQQGDFVVIELKVSRGYDRAVGQLLHYMGWVRENLGGDRAVRGVIVAGEIGEDVKLAASFVPEVTLLEYALSFTIKSVPTTRPGAED